MQRCFDIAPLAGSRYVEVVHSGARFIESSTRVLGSSSLPLGCSVRRSRPLGCSVHRVVHSGARFIESSTRVFGTSKSSTRVLGSSMSPTGRSVHRCRAPCSVHRCRPPGVRFIDVAHRVRFIDVGLSVPDVAPLEVSGLIRCRARRGLWFDPMSRPSRSRFDPMSRPSRSLV
jgi:hypothetical protein